MEHAKSKLSNREFQNTGSVVKDFTVHPGAGVGCKVGEKTVFVGNKKLMRLSNVEVDVEVEDYFTENEKLARTCVLVAVDGKVAGGFAVTDPVKPEAGPVVSFSPVNEY